MGSQISSFTKIHESASSDDNIPCTPKATQNLDPRSPYICRTPIGILDSATVADQNIVVTKNQDLTTDLDNASTTPTISNVLQQRLLRDLAVCSALDPRSPNPYIIRTPIQLKDHANASTDVLVDSLEHFTPTSVEGEDHQTSRTINRSPSPTFSEKIDDLINETFPDLDIHKKSYLETNFDFTGTSEIDPRSPSLNIERTPIVLTSSTTATKTTIVKKSELPMKQRMQKKALAEKKKKNKNMIYEDDEPINSIGILAAAASSTPKEVAVSSTLTPILLTNKTQPLGNRTPLGCLGKQINAADNNKVPLATTPTLKNLTNKKSKVTRRNFDENCYTPSTHTPTSS